jgi:hypothetical protein
MRRRHFPLIVALLAPALVLSCASPPAPAPPPAGAATAEELWTDFCHYVVIASPDLATAYGQRLVAEATSAQLADLLAADDETTRRAVRRLETTGLTDSYPELGAVWRRIRVHGRTADR